jgi:DNA-binding NarL/FixJ family response regulator
MAVRVVVAEDNALLRQGLERLLGRVEDVVVVGSAADLPSLERLLSDDVPDVLVTDIRMPPTGTDEGIRVASRLRETHPEIGVVVLSQYAEPAYALALLGEGSAGRAYLLKERVSDVDELVRAIREVAAGRSVIDPMVVETLVTAGRHRSPLQYLTSREVEVLAHMATGRTNAAIAAALVLSERAVEKHTNSIFAKLGLTEEPDVNRRVAAVLLYLADERS